jgi:hypothetical protein
MSSLDERRHEIGSDVSTPSDDDDTSHTSSHYFQPSIVWLAEWRR